MNSLPPTRHRRSEYLNASGGRCAEWFAACFDGGLFSSIRRDCMITASYLCNRLPHSAIKMEHRLRCFTAKTSTCRTSESSARGRVSSPRTQQSRSHVVGRDDVRPQPKWEQLIRYLEPQDASSCRTRELRLRCNTTAFAYHFQAGFAATGTGSSKL